MSASTEKKQRQAAREAGTDKKLLAAQEEAKKKLRSRRITTAVSVCVALLVVLIILLSTSFFYRHTTALTVGDRHFSPAEVNYYYAQDYYNWVNSYGSYASAFGLNTNSGPFALKKVPCPMLDGGSWRDYFLQSASGAMAQIKALTDYAAANGLSLTDELTEAAEEQLSYYTLMASAYGFSSLNNYLEANFGAGVNSTVLRQAMLDNALAQTAYEHYVDSLQYTDEELETYYASLNGDYDRFDYAYYYIPAGTAAVEGEESVSVTEDTLLEARMTAEAIYASYQDDKDTEDPVERLNAALEAEFSGVSATVRSGIAGNNLGELRDWLTAEHAAGDIGVVENASATGYNVVVFLGRDDNHYPTVSVRHILVNAEQAEDGTWSDEALEAAKTEAERILAEWQAGEATEESFAELAGQYSDDPGSNTNGGLYENIYKGQMVSEFDAFCFGGHKSGDTAVVYGSNGGYAGYHVIYFVGEGELYSNELARNELQNEAVSDWLTEITPEAKPGPAAWLAGK